MADTRNISQIIVSGGKKSIRAAIMVTLWLLLTTAVVCADENEERRSKLPYVADALGNTLPPPSNLPATVGSPVNLLTPDRYEFYTFDESGELVKRLMTLEEIQAIVAAGEETEGLVTFANDNQPTIAFNFSQPSYTKVHSVVTNVQNVLKAQMEAHKNNPHMQPTLDTPDVSDSWSLILPSIFGNTGVDIVPDKTTGSYITPETETIEVDLPFDYGEPFSKEGNSQLLTSSTARPNENYSKSSIPQTQWTRKSTTSTTTLRPTTKRPLRPLSSTTTKVTIQSIIQPKPSTSKPTNEPNVKQPAFTNNGTIKQTLINTTTNSALDVSSSMTELDNKIKTPPSSTFNRDEVEIVSEKLLNTPVFKSTTERGDIQYERISTFSPVSTTTSLMDKITNMPLGTLNERTKPLVSNIKKTVPSATIPHALPEVELQSTTNRPKVTSENIYLLLNQDVEKNNSTTITTQSVSPSSAMAYTQSTPFENSITQVNLKDNNENVNTSDSVLDEPKPVLPLFDVAQSISQIATDLGSAYNPIPTSNTLPEKPKINIMDMESKENLEINIASEPENISEIKTDGNNNTDNYIKISTLDPHEINKNATLSKTNSEAIIKNMNSQTTMTPSAVSITTFDPILSESMGDLLSQVVNENPHNSLDNVLQYEEKSPTTEIVTEISTEYVKVEETTTEVLGQIIKTVASDDIPINSSSKPIDNINGTQGTVSNDKIDNNVSINHETVLGHKKVVPFSAVNTPIVEDKPSSTEASPEIKAKETDMAIKNKEVLISIKDDKKSINSTLPSYKSEIGTNDSKTEKNSFPNFDTGLLEQKEIIENDHKEKGPELLPKVEEFKKKIQKVNIDDKEFGSDRNNSWKLIPTVSPSKTQETTKLTSNKFKTDTYIPDNNNDKYIVLDFSKENQGLEFTTKDLGEDIVQFTELCNELAFRYWNDIIQTIDKKRSFVFSPYAITSMLAMMFMGARGATSGEMNDILKLDDMVTFNPHFTLKNISDTIETSPTSGIAVAAFIRELYSDRNKGKILTFYKERAQHFYNGHVEEVNFKLISDIIRRRTNLLVKRYTWGKIAEYMKTNTIVMQPPLAAFSANILYTDCSGTSVDGRDGELYFVVSPNVRQRRLVPVPAVVYKNNFLAGYDPVLDVTAAALGNINAIVSTIFVMPGQQGNIVHAEDLEELEKRIMDSNPSTPAWNRLLRTLLPRVGLELQIPRFSHKSTFNISSTLKRMGLKDLFDADHADLGGFNGPSKDLYLSDLIQTNSFVTCGEGVIGEQHHVEQYPDLQRRRSARWVTGWDEPRDYQRAFHDPHDVGDAMHLPLHLRPRQARLPARNAQPARLKFDRPFLFFVRHNPSGMILYFGRYNPRLLP